MITQTLTTSFKVQLLQGVHNFGPTSPNTFKLALYSGTASLGADTTVYTTSGELPTANGYTQGGILLTINPSPTSSGTTAFVNFAPAIWTGASFTAAGALIYNASTDDNKSVAVLNFGGVKSPTAGIFTVTFPSATATSAIIRIT